MPEITPALYEILIRSLQGGTNEQEENALRRWRAQARENERFHQEMSAAWRMTAGYQEPSWTSPPTAREILLEARRRERSEIAGRRMRSSLRAAAVLACLGLGLGAAWWVRSAGSPVESTLYAEVSTGEGEGTTIQLWDGTAVRMGPRSTLRVLEEGVEPVLWLEGLAFFGVVPDSTRTFTVRTSHGEAEALGTRFEVRTEESGFQVLVVEGNVRVSTAQASIEVGEGLITRSTAGGPPATLRAENTEELLAWMGPTLMWRNTRLARALSEIESRYGVRVHLDAASMADFPVTATFTDQPIEGVMFVVCEIIGAECVSEGEDFRIQHRPGR